MQKMKKVLAILLTLSMVLSYVPVPALAEGDTCAHHEHDETCGYAQQGVCSYSCEQYGQEESVCTGLSDCSADEHEATCAKKLADDQAAAEAAKLAAEQAAAEAAAKAAADQAAADAVAALIDELPSLEEIQAKPMEEQGVDYNQVYAAYDAYGKLTEEQKALLPPAEDVFKPYFDYFTSQTEEVAATSGTCGQNLSWKFDAASGILTISGSGTMYDYSALSYAPWYDHRNEIIYATLPTGMTSIGDCAFYNCGSLTSITIGDSVTSIGVSAFSDCISLTSITIGDSVTSIGDYAFSNCGSLTSITIGDSVASIGFFAFRNCSSLIDVYIKDITGWLNIPFGGGAINPLHANDKEKTYI